MWLLMTRIFFSMALIIFFFRLSCLSNRFHNLEYPWRRFLKKSKFAGQITVVQHVRTFLPPDRRHFDKIKYRNPPVTSSFAHTPVTHTTKETPHTTSKIQGKLRMASTVIESWKLITAIDNYEEVAGKILFTRWANQTHSDGLTVAVAILHTWTNNYNEE